MRTFILALALCLNLYGGDEHVYVGQDFVLEEHQKANELVAIGSKGTISGEVEELVAIGSNITLTSKARIRDEMVIIGSRLDQDPRAQVSASQVNVLFPWGGEFMENFKGWDPSNIFTFPMRLMWSLTTLLLAVALGAFAHFLMPETFNSSVRFLETKKAAAFGFGAISYLLVVPVGIALIISIVGIFLLPVYVMAAMLVAFSGYFIAATAVGNLVPIQDKNILKSLAFGLVGLALLQWIPIFGGFISFVISIAGVGALIGALFDARKKRLAPPEAL